MTRIQEKHQYIEADLTPLEGEPTGKQWGVTIIGPISPGMGVTHALGENFLRSKNNRLYNVDAIAESVPRWEGVKVFDNHQTDEQFKQSGGMRSVAKELLGNIVNVQWDALENKLTGVFKVIDARLSEKLLAAFKQGVLGTIGLSIDTFPIIERETMVDGIDMPIIDGFKNILSVDLVGNPAAGGGFDRLIASVTNHEENNDMDEKAVKDLIKGELAGFDSKLDQLTALLTPAEEAVEEVEETPAEDEPENELDEAKATLQEARLMRAEMILEQKITKAKLPERFAKAVRDGFGGQVYDVARLERFIESMKKAQADFDPSGQPQAVAGADRINVGLNGDDKFAVEFMSLVAGRDFRKLESTEDDHVKERLSESKEWQAWRKGGKPNTGKYSRMSSLIYDYFGGDPWLNPHLQEASSTSNLASVVKNTVNILVAADYAEGSNLRWYEPLVTQEEVDTIDESTLVRLFGTDTLDVVSEGAAYTEMALTDAEETAAFVKRGNYVGVTWEVMMRDKINYIRSIPRRLAASWSSTLGGLVSGAFTVASDVGPTLSDTGALFNATATTTAGGHANLLTTALSYASFSAARIAMRKQTNQALGTGDKLQINPAFLLVPEDLETTARAIQTSELQPDADMDSGTGGQTKNQFQNTFQTIVVPKWTDVNNWALVADPRQFPAIYLIFPRGGRTPSIFTANDANSGSMFTNDELRYKVRLATYQSSASVASAPVADFRPLHKSNVS